MNILKYKAWLLDPLTADGLLQVTDVKNHTQNFGFSLIKLNSNIIIPLTSKEPFIFNQNESKKGFYMASLSLLRPKDINNNLNKGKKWMGG